MGFPLEDRELGFLGLLLLFFQLVLLLLPEDLVYEVFDSDQLIGNQVAEDYLF